MRWLRGSVHTRAPASPSNTRSFSRGAGSHENTYSNPEHPPAFTPTRRPAASVYCCAISLRIWRAALSVTVIIATSAHYFRNIANGRTSLVGGAGGIAAISVASSATDVAASAEIIRSLIRQRGSRMLHFEYWSQLWSVSEHAVTVSGPSTAWMTSATDIWSAGRASAYPPRMPCTETSSCPRTSFWSTLANSSEGMSYVSASSL